ncbi:MAG TPA: 50S ribosomal protein L24 [Bryobacteraceae bacterium]|nr:50S ribosomal protein L24 [Bryobacteraceae bacterium]
MARSLTEKQRAGLPRRILIRRNDTVQVIAGRDKGKTGRVLSVDRERGRVLVEHVQMVKRHTRPNPAKQVKGGIAERESPISVSNVMIVCPSCGPVRIGCKVEQVGGKVRRTRICRKCGAPLDKK